MKSIKTLRQAVNYCIIRPSSSYVKFICLCSMITCFQPDSKAEAQVTFIGKNVALEDVFAVVKKQTGYLFLYNSEIIRKANPVTIKAEKMPLAEFLTECLKGQPLHFNIEQKTIFILSSPDKILPNKYIEVSQLEFEVKGKVTDNDRQPLQGASVRVLGTNKGTVTDDNGEFILANVKESSKLEISFTGYETKFVSVRENYIINTILTVASKSLDETIIKGYYATTKRYNTGSVGKLRAEDIARQPVINPLGALQGRIPGLIVTQTSGLPNAPFSILLRGKGSLFRGTQPLFIIDGVPFLNDGLSSIRVGGQSPFTSINPNDIESIEVLRDGDATAIYGSQGANGVILITTKKGKPGKTRLAANISRGWGKITREPQLLNTKQYLEMRREAFVNDGEIPDISNAPDLLLWDSTKYTNWKELLISGTAKFFNAEISFSGGNELTQYLFSTSYNSQNTVFPNSKATTRATTYLNLSTSSLNRKFKAQFAVSYSIFKPQLPIIDLTNYIYLPPNAPDIYNSSGELNWDNWIDDQYTVDNPFGQILRRYESENSTLIGSGVIQYKLFSDFTIKASLGYTTTNFNEYQAIPIIAQRPPFAEGRASWSFSTSKYMLVEPQLIYKKLINALKIELLAGVSMQQQRQTSNVIEGSGYTDDDLLANVSSAGAGQTTNTNTFLDFKYLAMYANANLSWNNRYILNVNFRRDGSSRFGPGKRFANFGAVGAAWLFSSEKFFEKLLPYISFGKFRASYGVTGNGQIPDYAYFDSWSPVTFPGYQGSPGLIPNRLFNENFEWEKNVKFEIGMDLGLLQDRILIGANYYKNRCGNQLVAYNLPSQAGFNSIIANVDALIENSGYEFTLSAKNIESKKLKWTTDINISIPQNKLRSYPGLESSAYRYTFMLGQPLNVLFGYGYTGVNPITGIYEFEDLDKDGFISFPDDLKNIGSINPSYYGGLQNTFRYGRFELDIFIQFVKQTGTNYLATLLTVPGRLGNQPKYVLERWQKPGDISNIQKFTVAAFNEPGTAFDLFRNSSAIIQDASFVRLKNISLYFELPKKTVSKLKLNEVRLYAQAQNLLTLSDYKGADPENQSMTSLPPLRIINTGIQITL